MVTESARRPCISGRMMTEELKCRLNNSAPIHGYSRNALRRLARRLCLVTMLGISMLAVYPAAADQLVNPARTRVERMPDTWKAVANADSIYFDQGSSLIGDDAAALIQRHAATLKAAPGLQITLIAHTGDLGSSSMELARGQNRLEAVRKRLEDLKVPPGRIRTENHGSERRSVSPCTEAECLNRNRRVDVLFHR